MPFHVALNVFRGPLDLLLYLVRKHELEVQEIPLALVADQFLEHLELLQQLDVNAVGDFLEMASTLMEIKSRLVLPRGADDAEPLDEQRDELVARLLDYKQYRDAASLLEERGRRWQQRLPRLADDLPERAPDPADQPIREVELWDLVSAFGRIIRENQAVQPSSIVYDETPIGVYMRQIHELLAQHRRAAYSEMFRPGMHKSAMIGIFLAVLELVRHHSVRAEQHELHGEIWITPGERFDAGWDVSEASDFDQ